jgi:hypothetical protein
MIDFLVAAGFTTARRCAAAMNTDPELLRDILQEQKRKR